MKHRLLMAVCLGLTAPNIYAQAPASKECRTLEAAGNFIGADEVLVDGLVCKIAKAKLTTPAATATSEVVAEASGKPKLLRAGETKAAKPPSAEKATPSMPPAAPPPITDAQPGNAATGGVANARDTVMEVNRAPSVADIARAYQQATKHRLTEIPESLAVSKAARRTVPPSTNAEIPVAAASPASTAIVEHKTDAPAAAPEVRAIVEAKPQAEQSMSTAATPVVPATTSAAHPEIQPAAKGAVPEAEAKPEIKAGPEPVAPAVPATTSAAFPETQPASKGGAAVEQAMPEVRIEAVPATPTPEAPPAAPQTGTFDTTATSEATARDEVRQALPSTDNDSSLERPQEVKLGVFERPPEEMGSPEPADPFASTLEEASSPGPKPGCTRIVSLGSMEKDRLVLAIPDWSVKWLERNQKKYPGICFSDTPLAGVPNYLIVFFTAAAAPPQMQSAANKQASVKDTAGTANGTFSMNFGSTWHYTYENAATTTVTTDLTDKIPNNLQEQMLYATAYTEQGIPISQHWPVPTKGAEKVAPASHGKKHDPLAAVPRTVSDLLDQMLADLPLQ
jgi:hypothetical protein